MKNVVAENIMSTEKNKVSDKDSNYIWNAQEIKELKSRYGCEILKHNCTLQETKDYTVPTDAYIVEYIVDGEICYDLTRCGKRVNLFDMYYDKIGNTIRSIRWGYGKINPRNWGYSVPEKKKRK